MLNQGVKTLTPFVFVGQKANSVQWQKKLNRKIDQTLGAIVSLSYFGSKSIEQSKSEISIRQNTVTSFNTIIVFVKPNVQANFHQRLEPHNQHFWEPPPPSNHIKSPKRAEICLGSVGQRTCPGYYRKE